MTIKEATVTMLKNIRIAMIREKNYEKRIKDKDIAEKLKITPASLSRLITGVTTPNIQTWYRIILLHKLKCGQEKTEKIINDVS